MADCVWIQGSALMEAHPVGSRWALKARERGAKLIHVDPHFSRTSALCDLHVPIRAGSDIAFLGGLIRHIIETESYFKEYVVHYTNASMLLREDFADTEDLDAQICRGRDRPRHLTLGPRAAAELAGVEHERRSRVETHGFTP